MAPLRQIAFRLTAKDIAILDHAQERYGLASRTEALRYVLRQYDGADEVLRERPSKRTKGGKGT